MHTFLAAVAMIATLSAAPVRAATGDADRAQSLTCDTDPGRGLCRELRRLDSYLVDCTGDACYDLWRAQIRSMTDLANLFYADVDTDAVAERRIGDMAEKVARGICGAKWTGDAASLQRIAVAANRALKVTDALQAAAGEPLPYSCTLVVNRSLGSIEAQ